MINEVYGDILKADAEAFINTVNTVGVMGKGIALQFKRAFPANNKKYVSECNAGRIQLGQVMVFDRGLLEKPRYIINFPTKKHWRDKSDIQFIRLGLKDLVHHIKGLKITSIAIPPLGCGLGGLEWEVVRYEIIQALSSLDDVNILLYPPQIIPAAEKMRIATPKPKLTIAKAAILSIMDRYQLPGFRLSKLEIQKLAYFLQIAGISEFKLQFEKGNYGPYASNLEHLLASMEGHYTIGLGDRTGIGVVDPSIYIKQEVVEEVDEFMKTQPTIKPIIGRVVDLITGFETPYGLELLSTVHWIVTEEHPEAANDTEAIIGYIHTWNDRKRRTMKSEHIKIAWQRLKDEGWL